MFFKESNKKDKNKMKIGILTFHRAENFGAVLQCYSLQEYLAKKGHDVEIIDYRPQSIEKGYSYINIKYKNLVQFIKDFLLNIIPIKYKIRKKKRYDKFRQSYFRLSSVARTYENIPKKYDMIICGSDQVWNLRLTSGIDNGYFLNFSTKARKIAFSCSSEFKDYSRYDSVKTQLYDILLSFSRISVREKSLSIYLSEHLKIKSSVTCDPTFLQNRLFYEKLLGKPKKTLDKYVLVYNLVETSKSIEFAKLYARKNNLSVVVVHAGFRGKYHGDLDVFDAGPLELLNYIRNASYVVTTSFHGLALSLILNKQVCVIDKGPNIRQKNLLEDLGLLYIIVDEMNSVPTIDYDIVNNKIKIYSEPTFNYLNDVLNDE